ncbi:hypothetical protein PENTCL1PPCAC_1530, partial [Pristionchus entomophagus]
RMGDRNVLQPVEEIADLRRELAIRDMETAEKREKLEKVTSDLIARQSREIAELRRELAENKEKLEKAVTDLITHQSHEIAEVRRELDEKMEEAKKSSLAFDAELDLKNREIADLRRKCEIIDLKKDIENLREKLEETAASMEDHQQIQEQVAPASNRKAKRKNHQPLIPTDWASALEGTKNFQLVFEERYGNCKEVLSSGRILPPFFIGSLQEAITEAFECPDRPDSERRPLALYIHHDGSIARNVFPSTVMCSDLVQPVLRSQFIMWPWDVTEKENEVKFIEWLSECSLYDASELVTSFLDTVNGLPVLILLSMDGVKLKMFDFVESGEGPEETMEKLLKCVDAFASSKLTMGDNGETTANDNAGGDRNADYMTLKIFDQDANEVHFRVKPWTLLGRLKNRYADKRGVTVSSLRFLFNGRSINDDDTPMILEMEEDDVIEVSQNTD